MTLRETLTTLEEAFWTGDAEFYRAKLSDGCRMVFPGIGTMSREAAIEGVESGRRWASVKMSEVQVTSLGERVAVLSYMGVAERSEEGSAYRAHVGSVYEKDGPDWKLAFHQHTLAA